VDVASLLLRSAASLTHVLVQQHAENERDRVSAVKPIGGGVLGDAELRHPGSVPQRGPGVTDFSALVARWAERASTEAEKWPDDPAEAVPDRAALEAIARRAAW
jgi:hypothetical protein